MPRGKCNIWMLYQVRQVKRSADKASVQIKNTFSTKYKKQTREVPKISNVYCVLSFNKKQFDLR